MPVDQKMNSFNERITAHHPIDIGWRVQDCCIVTEFEPIDTALDGGVCSAHRTRSIMFCSLSTNFMTAGRFRLELNPVTRSGVIDAKSGGSEPAVIYRKWKHRKNGD